MDERILARVGTLTVSEGELEAFIAELGQRGQNYNNPEGRKVILEQLIADKLFLLDARRNLLEGDPAFRAQLNQLKDKLLIRFAAEKALSAVTVSEADAKTYYEENAEQFVTGETVNASHILVDSEALANEILAKINAGEISFEDAARQYSSCPSKENGGNLGDFSKGQMVAEFDNAVFSMNAGEISSSPVKTQFGYHIIKLNSKNESETVPFEQIKDRIKGLLMQEKKAKAYESKVNQLKIMYPVDVL